VKEPLVTAGAAWSAHSGSILLLRVVAHRTGLATNLGAAWGSWWGSNLAGMAESCR